MSYKMADETVMDHICREVPEDSHGTKISLPVIDVVSVRIIAQIHYSCQ